MFRSMFFKSTICTAAHELSPPIYFLYSLLLVAIFPCWSGCLWMQEWFLWQRADLFTSFKISVLMEPQCEIIYIYQDEVMTSSWETTNEKCEAERLPKSLFHSLSLTLSPSLTHTHTLAHSHRHHGWTRQKEVWVCMSVGNNGGVKKWSTLLSPFLPLHRIWKAFSLQCTQSHTHRSVIRLSAQSAQ